MNSIESKDKNFAQNRVATQKRVTPTTSHEVPEEPYSHEWAMRRLFLCKSAEWLSKEDILSYLRENYGRTPSEGTFRNIITTLKAIDYIETRRSTFAEYHLKPVYATAQCEVDPTRVLSRRGSVLRVAFGDYLSGLPWEEIQRVHNIRLWVSLESLGFVNGEWKHSERSRQYVLHCIEGGLRVVLLASYGCGKSLSVMVRNSNAPLPYGVEGLTALFQALMNVRGRYLSDSVPSVGEWIVQRWDFGRDTVLGSVSGASFNLEFQNWFGELCRVYTKGDGRVRREEIQSPNRRLSVVMEKEQEKELLSGQVASMASEIRYLRGFVASGP